MKKIKIVTDNTGLITKDYSVEHKVDIVPLKIDFAGETIIMKYPEEIADYYERLKNSKDFPKTSQPPTGEFLEVYENAFNEDYDHIMVIVMSSGLSGTYNSACLAADMCERKGDITIIDSLTTVANLKHMVMTATEMAESGCSPEKIKDKVLWIRDNMGTYLYVDNLEYLKRGGRISATKAAVGTILNVKPIIIFDQGVLSQVDKVRGKIKAQKYLMNKVPEDVKRITICQILNMDVAEKAKKDLEELFPDAVVDIDGISPIIGSHLGEHSLGFVYSK